MFITYLQMCFSLNSFLCHFYWNRFFVSLSFFRVSCFGWLNDIVRRERALEIHPIKGWDSQLFEEQSNNCSTRSRYDNSLLSSYTFPTTMWWWSVEDSTSIFNCDDLWMVQNQLKNSTPLVKTIQYCILNIVNT